MVEMRMENDRVERLRLRQLGEDWIRAITEGAVERLERLCQPDVISQALTPERYVESDHVAGLIENYRRWFGACSDFQIEQRRVEPVGERLGIFYRFHLQENGEWFVVEQQLYCIIENGRIARLHALCSGFQPAAPGEPQEAAAHEAAPHEAAPERDALLVFQTGLGQDGATCALLTPAINAKLREMVSGQVLEVQVDDPTARSDIEAWCRLSGNTLLKMIEGEGADLRFFVKKK